MAAKPRAGQATAAWTVGIDLGTTHTVVACAAAGSRAADPIRLFQIPQLVAPGEVAARPLLPSLRYHPAEGELAPGATTLPWPPADGDDGAVIGQLARRLGAAVPGRLVASAKSWLSHAAVDRLAAILPWGAPAGVRQVSPVAASAGTLAHVRAAWDHAHPDQPLAAQALVLTVPASFDDTARTLTLEAARAAGLPQLRLLEEPQAALYDWLLRHRSRLAEALGGARLVLVCDVGGGTTDLSLVKVDPGDDGTPRFERVAVGRHLMLGGDNMDLALAHLAESRLAAAGGGAAPRLSAGALAQLVERCRAAKEQLLAADAPASVSVTLLGSGAGLVGGARTVELTRDEVRRIVVDGFFPQGAADEGPQRARGSGLVAFGLPYASDAAVTRHIAAFLQQHADAGWPDALLLNGGVFRAEAIATRLQATLAAWRGAPLRLLHNADPDVAVARGAVAYALAGRGRAPRIGGGSPRSYFLLLGEPGSGAQRGVCLLPRGSEAGHEIRLAGRQFALRIGEPVRFRVAATTADRAPPQAGDVVELDGQALQPLPPIATVLRAAEGAADGAGAGGRRAGGEITVQLMALLTEVGTLELHCAAEHDPTQRWQLAFQLRGEPAAPPQALPARLADAVRALQQVFGTRDAQVDPRAVRQLRRQLEALLGPRDSWPTAVLRPLFDALLQGARGRRRSADHERLWLSLAGWCLRPGFGDALDGWRITQLWPLYAQGVQHGHEAQVSTEWWTLWRRVAGGLDAAQQQTLLDAFALNLRGSEADIRSHAPRLVKGSRDDMVRLGASLERVEAAHKVEVGDWLVGQLVSAAPPSTKPAASPSTPPATQAAAPPATRPGARPAAEPAEALWTAWAIGRLGARVPLYGSAHGVVPAEVAAAWLQALLALDWRRLDGAAAAAASLARLSGDRARDLPEALRAQVVTRLLAHRAPPVWAQRVREVVALDEAGERSAFGESLPPGLKLIA